MEGDGANMVSELNNKLLLDDVKVCSRGFRGFGRTVQMLDHRLPDFRRSLLFRDLPLPVVRPVDLASANFPLVTNCSLELGLCKAWRQAAQDKL